MTDAQLFEAVLAEIRAGIALARQRGVVCGPVLSLTVMQPKSLKQARQKAKT